MSSFFAINTLQVNTTNTRLKQNKTTNIWNIHTLFHRQPMVAVWWLPRKFSNQNHRRHWVNLRFPNVGQQPPANAADATKNARVVLWNDLRMPVFEVPNALLLGRLRLISFRTNQIADWCYRLQKVAVSEDSAWNSLIRRPTRTNTRMPTGPDLTTFPEWISTGRRI